MPIGRPRGYASPKPPFVMATEPFLTVPTSAASAYGANLRFALSPCPNASPFGANSVLSTICALTPNCRSSMRCTIALPRVTRKTLPTSAPPTTTGMSLAMPSFEPLSMENVRSKPLPCPVTLATTPL